MSATPNQPDVKSNRPLIDGNVLFFMGLAAVTLGAVVVVKGVHRALSVMESGLLLTLSIAPMIAVGLYLGGLARELADPNKVAPQLGTRSGWYGLALASLLGAVTPGGPFAAFPIVYALFLAGADIGAVIAYLTGWSLLALHRVIIWEIPLLGAEFSAVRVAACLPLPILAGWLARRMAYGPLAITAPARIVRKDDAA
jgi:uncharacterized membrane protein YraQ (UPF0718 family)